MNAPDPQQPLSQLVQERRRELGLSVRAAAKKAGVDRNTWASVEDGSRTLQDRNYTKFEQALELPGGTIDAYARGVQPPEDAPTHEWSAAERAQMREMSDAEVQEAYEFFRSKSQYLADVWLREVKRVKGEAKAAQDATTER
ncbi:helix-turn-helix domain-containing protein [Amycolatopsis thailandensis]|uniref:helix-turn-helix domain-containing protein n=1 Tax=Amycolatopsis thailandensis TaxID=589330 RepID=UPI0037B1292C